MTNDQFIIVRVSAGGTHITYWVEDAGLGQNLPKEKVNSNRYTSAASAATALQTELNGVSLST